MARRQGLGKDARRRHPWHLALGLWIALVALELAAAKFSAAEAVLFAPERALGVPARFAERPVSVAGPFPPAFAVSDGAVLYPVIVPLLVGFAFAQVTRHARLSYWLALALFASFPFVRIIAGRATFASVVVPESLGWGAAIGAVAGLVAGPRSRGTMRRAEAAPVIGLLALGAIALYPVHAWRPEIFPLAAAAYALGGAAVAWMAGQRWREHAVGAAAASGTAFGLALAAEVTGTASGALTALVLAPLWTAAAMAGVASARRVPTRGRGATQRS